MLRKALRVNTIKITEEKLLSRLKKKKVKLNKIPFVKSGYWYEADFSLGSTPEYLQGLYYLQEAASQKPSELLDPKPGEHVLDMTAAPGSKTTQIAALMKNKGVLVAVDSNIHRIPSLKNNLERCGVKNCIVYQKDGQHVTDLKEAFDKVLLDAPCSGNEAINPEYHIERYAQDIKACARLQVPLLHEGLDVLKPGGVLIYSTCSEQPEENEEVIRKVLDERDDVIVEKIKDRNSTKEGYLKYESGVVQGFFIAKLKKKA